MINFNIEEIYDKCKEFNVILDEDKIKKLNMYGNLLLEWNEKINLTAIKEPNDVLYKHFYDCILFLKHTDIKKSSSLIDVGTGAGFPGMVLKIVRPDIKVTLLDSLNKRLLFLNDVIEKLDLLDIETIHMRAEEAGKSKKYREKFDISCARAVAPMNILMEYCMPFVKVGGEFVAMKGPTVNEETNVCKNAIKVLGASQPTIICETLTGNEQRAFVKIKKISQTLPKYPRISSNISKQPL